VLVGEGPKSTPTQSLLNAMRFDCFAPIPAVRLTMIGRLKSTPKQSFVARD
jgi:hypothetical protein